MIQSQMGKKQWAQWKGSGKASYGGGWQQESAAHWGDGSYGWEDPQYPTYSHAASSAPARPPVEKPRTETAAAGLVRAVQRLLTTARKAEVKTRKLAEEQEKIEANWSQFQQDLRAKFVRARETYKADKEKIAQALAESENAQTRAFQELQEAMNNPGSPVERKEPELPAAIAKEWEALLGEDDSDEEMTQAAIETVPQRMKDALGAPRTPMTPPSTSAAPRRASTTPLLAAMTTGSSPPGFGADGAVVSAVGDPYQTSPTMRMSLPSPPVPPPGRARSRSVTRRTPIKEVGKTPKKMETGGALSKRLEERRQSDEEIPVAGRARIWGTSWSENYRL